MFQVPENIKTCMLFMHLSLYKISKAPTLEDDIVVPNSQVWTGVMPVLVMTGTDLQQCDIENNLQEKWPLSNCKIDAN
jgi:hypothetical protein